MGFIDTIKAKAKADLKTIVLPESEDDRTFKAAGTGGRADSAISYVTPNMSGFQAAVAYVHKNNIGANAKSIWEIGAWYKNGGLGVGLSANKNVVGKKT